MTIRVYKKLYFVRCQLELETYLGEEIDLLQKFLQTLIFLKSSSNMKTFGYKNMSKFRIGWDCGRINLNPDPTPILLIKDPSAIWIVW